MAWLDERAWCHPKLVNLSDRAFRVYINGISYSSGMGLRGILTPQHQRLMGATPKVRRELIESELWDERSDAVYIHDWDIHNGKRDDRRAADRERKRAARAAERAGQCPQDSPPDSPQDAPHSRRALKEVKEVKEVNVSNSQSELQDATAGEIIDFDGVLKAL